jgi:hypothetical protein
MDLLASCFWCGCVHAAQHPLSVCPTCMGSYRARRFPLGPVEMSGSFPLDDAMIDEVVSRTSPGNYALGYMDAGTFVVFYVGRSDSDVKRRLHEWVGASSRYERFAPSTRAPRGAQRRGAFPVAAPAQGHVGAGVDSSYTRFAYSYAASAAAAFEKECRNYDDFGGSGGLDNAARPVSTAA